MGGQDVDDRLVLQPSGDVAVGNLLGSRPLAERRLLYAILGRQRRVVVIAHVSYVGDVLHMPN